MLSSDFDEQIIINDREKQIMNLDSLPYWDRSLLDYEKYYKYVGISGVKNTMTMQGSRGCPYSCFYCDVRNITPFHRRRSNAHIIGEIKSLYRLGVRRFEFIDDAFNINNKEFKNFFKEIIAGKFDIELYFPNGLRGDVLDKEAIDLSVEAGTKNITLSLESASPRLQKMMGKNLNLDKFHENINYIASKYPQVVLTLNAMIGFPTETEKEAAQTFEFIRTIKWLHFPYIHLVRIFPNSRIEKIALENGVTKKEIEESYTIPFHVISPTIKLDHGFIKRNMLAFSREYVFNKERLKVVIQNELSVYDEAELILKYRSVFPTHINTLEDVLKLAHLKKSEMVLPKHFKMNSLNTDSYILSKEKREEVEIEDENDKFKILYIDISQHFSDNEAVYGELNMAETPMGGMALLSYLNRAFPNRIACRVTKTGIDFNSYEEILDFLRKFKPNIIFARTMTYYKDFFVECILKIKEKFSFIPIIAGGPHPTIDPEDCLRKTGIEACVIGEGEIIVTNLIDKMINNGRHFPSVEELKQIKGLVFMNKSIDKEQIKYVR